MSIVTIKVNNKNFDLYCPEENKAALIKVTEKLNAEIDNMKKSNPSASFELLLVMTALKLQDDKISQIQQNSSSIIQEVNQEFQSFLGTVSGELQTIIGKIKA